MQTKLAEPGAIILAAARVPGLLRPATVRDPGVRAAPRPASPAGSAVTGTTTGSGTPRAVDLVVIRRRLAVAMTTLLLAVGCRPPSPAVAPTPIITVSVPTTSVEAPAEVEPAPSPWERLLALQAVFSGGTPEPPCPADQAATVLVVDGDEGTRVALAEEAGCVAHSPVAHGEVQLCCPTGLEAPSATRTGEGKSCEQAREEYVANHNPEAFNDAPGPGVTASLYGRVLSQGRYLNACNVKANWGVTVCAAIQNGAAAGVSVRTTPASIETADCIAKEIREIVFPPSPTMDIIETTFAPSE